MARHLLLAGLLVVAPQLAVAAQRNTMITGTGLTVDTPCAIQVDIRPDSSLHGRVAISATADHQEELDRLVLDSGSAARVHTGPLGCWRPLGFGSFTRTLRLALRIPGGLPLSIDESGAGNYAIGDVGGPLTLDISGAAQVHSGAVTRLTAGLSGSGTVYIDAVRGTAEIGLSGHGDVTVADMVAPSVDVDISGAGMVAITTGTIGAAKLQDSGFGKMAIGATVDTANVDVSGAGSIRFKDVTGLLTKNVSGVGSVTVGP